MTIQNSLFILVYGFSIRRHFSYKIRLRLKLIAKNTYQLFPIWLLKNEQKCLEKFLFVVVFRFVFKKYVNHNIKLHLKLILKDETWLLRNFCSFRNLDFQSKDILVTERILLHASTARLAEQRNFHIFDQKRNFDRIIELGSKLILETIDSSNFSCLEWRLVIAIFSCKTELVFNVILKDFQKFLQFQSKDTLVPKANLKLI